MFKLSSRAAGSVNCDSIQIIKSADQTVNVIGNVNGADGSDICPRVCLSSGLSSCYQVRRVMSWIFCGAPVWLRVGQIANKASRNQLSQQQRGPVHVGRDSLTRTHQTTVRPPHTHLNNKNTHLALFWRCRYHQKQTHKLRKFATVAFFLCLSAFVYILRGKYLSFSISPGCAVCYWLIAYGWQPNEWWKMDKTPWCGWVRVQKHKECLGAFMVCGLQHKATHERTATTITTINLRHRWAIKRKNKSWMLSLVCWMKRWRLCKEVQARSNWNF